ncbi:MAG: hypothetical protein HPY65_00785 [Syntrophaceae bacterium]|nr:hypothetical protein [Syntrophaceae bacterium]
MSLASEGEDDGLRWAGTASASDLEEVRSGHQFYNQFRYGIPDLLGNSIVGAYFSDIIKKKEHLRDNDAFLEWVDGWLSAVEKFMESMEEEGA